jgi:hypothetical protein
VVGAGPAINVDPLSAPMDVTEIRSLKQFRAWLREHGGRGEWFGRIGFDERSLLVSRERVWKFEWNRYTPDELPLYPLALPRITPASAAKEWWHEIFEQRIGEFFRNRDMPIYCIVRVGTWRALPDWCVERSKDDWEVITPEAFEAEVGPTLWREMLHEHGFLGFSIREVREPAA